MDTMANEVSKVSETPSNNKITLPTSVLEKLYQRNSIKQRRAGLECFLAASVLFDLWAIFIPQGQSQESLGQITQWDLIFHGTDDPVQPNDPPRKPKSGLELSYGGALGHNSLEFESDPASGMWRDVQQIGESHVDVQRTASKDETGTACRNFAPNKQCIECYTACPQRSFMVPEEAKSPSLSLRSIVNKRAYIPPAIPQKQCETCHFSCLNCRGPNDYDCTECTPDSALTVKSSNESYCSMPNQQLPVHDPSTIGSTYVFLLILGPAIVVLIFVVIVSCVIKSKFCGESRKRDYVYDVINANDAWNDEEHQLRIEDIPINAGGGSEEESD